MALCDSALFQPERIAIFRALQLGDLLVAVPALRALRARFPKAEITLIGLPWAAAFVRRYCHLVDRFVEFTGYPGIAEVPVDTVRSRCFLAEQRAYGYDLVVQMHGSGQSSNPFVLALHGQATIGYYEGTLPAGLILGALYPHDQHEIMRNLGLAALLGCSQHNPELDFPLFEEDYAEAELLLRSCEPDRPLVGIHPGARSPAKCWPTEYFALLADELSRRFRAQIVLTGGPGEEATTQSVIEHMRMPALNLVGQTSLGGLAALISRLSLFISNDTGPAHLACAMQCPSITLFGPADYKRWAPLNTTLHPSLQHPVVCSPCGYWQCPIDHRCLRWLHPEVAMVVAERFLIDETSKNSHLAYPWQLPQYVGTPQP